jgi:hypothetical protein
MDTTSTARWRHLGDAAADAAAAAAGTYPAAASALRGLARGEPLPSGTPAAVSAFAAEVGELPRWTDPERMNRGSAAYLAFGPTWIQLVLGAGSLVDTYRAPAIAHALARSGRLLTMARRRIEETGHWISSAVLPDALGPGRPGRLATVQVRLLHARMRARLLDEGWEIARWGMPINQLDLARTLLDFAHLPVTALRTLGLGLRPEEQGDVLHLWSAIGHLLGVATELLPFSVGRACRLTTALDAALPAPGPESRALVAALVEVYVEYLPALLHVSPHIARELMGALIRRVHGADTAGALGIAPAAAWTGPALAAIALGNRTIRGLRRAAPPPTPSPGRRPRSRRSPPLCPARRSIAPRATASGSRNEQRTGGAPDRSRAAASAD